MKCSTWHDVYKERGDFVEAMKHKRIAPHNYGYGIITECQAVGGSEKSFRAGEDPKTQEDEEISEVAKIGEEVVIATAMIGEIADRHEVDELGRVPDMHILRITAD